MLSPHEIAALMLLDTNPLQSDLDIGDLAALCERQLILLEELTSGNAHRYLTPQGRAVLQSVAKVH